MDAIEKKRRVLQAENSDRQQKIEFKRDTANRVRALAAANPNLDPLELSKKAGIDRGEVRAALARKGARRKKTAV